MPIGPNPNRWWSYPGIWTQDPSLESLWGGIPEMENSTLPFPQRDPTLLGAGQDAQRARISHGPMRLPTHSVAILDTQSRLKSLCFYLPSTRMSHPDELPQGLQIVPAITSPLTLTRVGV